MPKAKPAPLALAVPESLTMSSREIAELTGKEHKHVMRDIRTMLTDLGDGPVLDHVSESKDARGYTAEIRLPKDLTINRKELLGDAWGTAGKPLLSVINEDGLRRLLRQSNTKHAQSMLKWLDITVMAHFKDVLGVPVPVFLPGPIAQPTSTPAPLTVAVPESLTGAAAPLMSSREIAELTGKEHKNVLADIRKMLAELGVTSAEFSANLPDSYGRAQQCFNLPKDLTLTLVAGYNVRMRHRIVTRWMELESQAAKPQAPTLPDFTNPAEAARAWADQHDKAAALAGVEGDLTMSSREIAELTGKRHADVMRDLRAVFSGLDIDSTQFCAEYRDSTGRPLPMFNLPKDLTLTLVAGYNVRMRHRIVSRWMELEAKEVKPKAPVLPDFTNPAEAARAWASGAS
ncbi:Rha family transcriptional regulator [Ottowia testudinis]|uniref:Rha family transcriptional regulator n=1 Tax=Ottowia testudinis TaxID=2816950 RepID=A0A975CD15_9BURK|nr:Rha family transcriptional regulator [Ottowia testudinis]QTD44213.1 Rha family transcriptional regulator [Ottowia testudinis]